MSGALSAIGGLVTLISGTGVSLGGVAFLDMEVPEKIGWGGRQQIAVHHLPGGGRVIDSMGADEAPIEWHGYFRGGSAAARARQIDAMRQAGKPVALTWGGFSRNVIICSFECDYAQSGFLLPYRISCEVVPATPVAAASLLGDLGGDLGAAVQAAQPLVTSAQNALTQIQTVMPVAGQLLGGSSAMLAIQGAVNSAQSTLSSVQGTADATMGAIQTASAGTGGILGATSAGGGVSALLNAGQASQTLAAVTQAAGYVKRMAANITGAST